MGILPLKKRVNRDKCSFATKQRMFGVFAIDEILRYRGSRIPGSPTLCHPAQYSADDIEDVDDDDDVGGGDDGGDDGDDVSPCGQLMRRRLTWQDMTRLNQKSSNSFQLLPH